MTSSIDGNRGKMYFTSSGNPQDNRSAALKSKLRLSVALLSFVALLIPLSPAPAGAAPLLNLGELLPILRTGELTGPPGGFAEGELMVRFDRSVDPSERAQVRQRQRLEKIEDLPLPGLELVRTSGTRSIPEVARSVASEKSVVYAEPNFIATPAQVPNDPYFSHLWGLHNGGQSILGVIGLDDADVNGPEAWNFGGTSTPVVAVVDSGVDISHPDLAANIWINREESATANGVDTDGNGYVDDRYGWDFLNNDNTVFDANEISHGTHVAGTIGAVRGNGIGVAGVSQAKIMVLKFLDGDGGTMSGAIKAIDYAVKNGAAVSNHSWATNGYSKSLSDIVAWAGTKGHLVVAAAGNGGGSLESNPHYPASFTHANVVSVAATDNNDQLASFSNYGEVSVDLGAPGVSIASTVPGSYQYMSGTSMAAPHVAGAAAQILSLFPGMGHPELKAALLDHGEPISSLKGKTVTGRRLDMAGSLEAVASPQVSIATSSFQPRVPTRILDTRPDKQIGYMGDKPGAGSTVELQVTGRGGVPSSGVSAVIMNVTATDATKAGYVTAWPTGQARPQASNLNLAFLGQTIPNLVTVPVGQDGKVSLFTQGGTHLIADVAGYFQPAATASSGRQVPLTPARLLDTRPANKIGYTGDKPGDGSTTKLQVTGRGGVPPSGVSAVVLNVTATATADPGWITVWPSHLSRPLASNLNLTAANQTIANSVIVPVSPDGQVSLYTVKSTHLVSDVFGYYTDASAPESGSGLFVPTIPTRLLDTRSGVGYSGSKPTADSTTKLQLAGRAPLPDSGVASVVMNVTSVDSDAAGHITVWPVGLVRPSASNINPERKGQVIPNLVTSPLSSAGAVNLYTLNGGHLVADVAGYYTN